MSVVLPATEATETRPVETKPVLGTRNLAFDRARSCIIVMVLMHHSVIPYTYYGHTDKQSFLPFDGFVTFNDSYFMAAMFLLSGLFVWSSLKRKGVGDFLRGRLLRLALPFAIGAVILMPMAYYAIELRNAGPGAGFLAFWWKTITVGPWESGPIWFLAVLFIFDMCAAAVFSIAPGFVEALGQISTARLENPFYAFWMFLAASVIVYAPFEFYLGIGRWLTLGPLAVQADRILLYLLYFFTGAGIGAVHGDRSLLSDEGELARRWPAWLVATVVTYAGLIGLIFYKREYLADPNDPPGWWNAAHSFFFASFSASQTINLLALFLRFDSRGRSILDPLRENSFGIFLIHYVPLLWLQYALYGVTLAPLQEETAILKALIVFVLTLAISWLATLALRRIPGARHVL
ncbi:acyltransferase family protein [Bradyrhizobium erythrophlei]|jgi:surface polysaccharide O-acyltransferase-like enzyme|uniref:Acyltransferase family protein n=1 Tax=Bradyrhizobium erythrophlei TaxID=1437360 RepID=A0A1M7UJN6_9BRAD|nr:acyltransferase [Bradyrhizobium erythrophlei]SHN83222.1 Acyltransferase family protein [Bradyrhizobium erythrophlei]